MPDSNPLRPRYGAFTASQPKATPPHALRGGSRALAAAYLSIVAGLQARATGVARAATVLSARTTEPRALDFLAGAALGTGFGTASCRPGKATLLLFTAEPLHPEDAFGHVASAFGVDLAGTRDYPVEAIHTGPIDALNHRAHMRPSPAGMSVGHFAVAAGTLGAFARGRTAPRDRNTYILSNNHILANANDAAQGDAVLQPGPYDGGTLPADQIAALESYAPISFTSPNVIDAAVAVADPALSDPQYRHAYFTGGTPEFFALSNPPAAAAVGMAVGKVGRATELTQGVIVSDSAAINVNMGGGRIAHFQNQIAVRPISASPFSAAGDSGSVIWTWDGLRPVALLFAGGTGMTFGNPIEAVLDALDIDLLP